MSKTRPCTCIALGCQSCGQIKHADIEQIQWHLRQKHDYKELQLAAFEIGIVSSIKDYRGHDWLIKKLAYACLGTNYLEV